MKIGFVGLGKLGLPVALALETAGHEVFGYDINPAVAGYVANRQIPYEEVYVPQLLESTELRVLSSVEAVVAEAPDVVFVPVQTPHAVRFEGVTRLPEERVDFDYSWLRNACSDLADALREAGHTTIVAIISTVLPGTIEREIMPVLGPECRLVYTPQFIAMGTVVPDFLEPEFTLLGVDDHDAAQTMEEMFSKLTGRPVFATSIRNAEGIKVFYNSMITMKTVLGNIWGELSEKLGMDADEVLSALSMADRRLMSPAYLRSGVGDGGGCHPRDNIALSWLARKVGLSYDIFESMMLAREAHMDYIAERVVERATASDLPVVVWGWAFKPRTNITTGSPARLLYELIEERGVEIERVYDPHVPVRPQGAVSAPPMGRSVIVIATDHGDWPDAPVGSVVIDPFGSYQDLPGVTVERLGRRTVIS